MRAFNIPVVAFLVLLVAILLAACQPAPDFETRGLTSPVGLGAFALRGHEDLKEMELPDLENSDNYLAWFVGSDLVLQWCVQAPVEQDTSRWQVALDFDQHPSTEHALEFSSPVARKGSVICYKKKFPEDLEDGVHELCAVLNDRLDVWQLPCLKLYYERTNAQLQGLLEQRSSLLTTYRGQNVIQPMIELAGLAEQNGFLMFATSTELIAAHFLKQRGKPGDLQEISEMLEKPRMWLDSHSAHGIAGLLHYQRAVTLLDQGERNKAWSEIRLAEERYRQVAHPQTIVAVTRRAEILMQTGAVQEAQQKLNRSILECQHGTCEEGLLRNAKNAMAWWLIQNPYVTLEQVQRADQLLTEAMVGAKGLEQSNILLNQAYLIVLRGGDPSATLVQAQQLLTQQQSARADALNRWSQFIRAVYLLQQHEDQKFLDITQALNSAGQPDYLQARVHTVRGQYYRQQKEYSLASIELIQAVQDYQYLGSFNQRVVVNPSQQAEAYFELAGLAADQNNAALAWQWLDKLDASFARTECPASVTLTQEKRAAELYSQLAQLDTPASSARHEQRDSIRFQLQDELQELMRSQSNCDSDVDLVSSAAQFRGFLTSDEVILLRQNSPGDVQIEKRTPIQRMDFVNRIRTVNQRMHPASLNAVSFESGANLQALEVPGATTLTASQSVDAKLPSGFLKERQRPKAPPGNSGQDWQNMNWHDLTAPLAAALLPKDTGELATTTSYALHDVLQNIPIHALPYEKGWFSDVTTIVMSIKRKQPLEAIAKRKISPDEFLFIVDPSGNLPKSGDAVERYRVLFPQAAYLVGAHATTESVERAMHLADVWHIDSHARFESAFPELSPLIFYDGELTAGQLNKFGGEVLLINLSGCQTGTWPVTATQGQYGMAGALAKRKAQWVIASRVPLKNSTAIEFNNLFYKSFTLNNSVPEAYASALRGLKRRSPVADWANLLLVGHVEGANRSVADSY